MARLNTTITALLGAALLASCAPAPASVPAPEAARGSSGPQQYDDGRVLALPPAPAAASPAACDAWNSAIKGMTRQTIAPLGDGTVGEFYRPELMAIGDSLFNGVQSLRINWFLSQWSAPSLVAIRLGLVQERNADRTGQRVFYGPRYPGEGASATATESFGFNLEDLPSLDQYAAVPGRAADQLQRLAFGAPAPNSRPMVDNIAYLGANSYDLLYWTPADYRRNARKEISRLRRLGLVGALSLPDAVFDANAAFVLNPTRNPCLEGLTPVAQVELRHPRRLLVSIGANDGMYSLAFASRRIDQRACEDIKFTPKRHPSCSDKKIKPALLQDYTANIRTLLTRLAAVDGLEAVYLNNLPFPSRTANLVPFRRGADWFWYNDLMSAPGDSADDISRKLISSDADVMDADRLIDQVNAQLKDIVAEMDAKGPTHFALVDVNERLGQLDAKRCDKETAPGITPDMCKAAHGLALTQAHFGGGADVRLDNRPIRFDGSTGLRTGSGFATKITEGGLESFDNMHLTSVGYELMAAEIVAAMRAHHDRLPLDACPEHPDPAHPTAFGACAGLLVQPGWSYEDSTRREYSFLRTTGLQETDDREVLSRRIYFVTKLLHIFKPPQTPALAMQPTQ